MDDLELEKLSLCRKCTEKNCASQIHIRQTRHRFGELNSKVALIVCECREFKDRRGQDAH
jgi:hypothetical protein